MNVARRINNTDTAYNQPNKKASKADGAKIIYLAGKNNQEDKKVTLDYLNEKLAYFYNNGGPIMDI